MTIDSPSSAWYWAWAGGEVVGCTQNGVTRVLRTGGTRTDTALGMLPELEISSAGCRRADHLQMHLL